MFDHSSNSSTDYVKLILNSKVYQFLKETPLDHAASLSNSLEEEVLLKREDLHPIFSFKCRGAHNCISNLDLKERSKGVVACSAGNHAQGVALSAKRLGIKAKIVMPLNTPTIKVESVKRLGAEVVLCGNDFNEAKEKCEKLAKLENLSIIHPFDDKFVIAGQGTIGLEISKQVDLKEVDSIFVCVGGGGMVSGILKIIKYLNKHIKIFGVETTDSNAMTQSLLKGERVFCEKVGMFADGAAVSLVGKENFKICYELLDGLINVTNDELCAAIKNIFEDTRSISEPAGALGLAGLKKWIQYRKYLKLKIENISNKKFVKINQHVILSQNCIEYMKQETKMKKKYVAIISGANMDFTRLRFIADRAEIGLRKEVILHVKIKESPGSFVLLHNLIHPRSITKFSYRYSNKENADIIMSFMLANPENRENELYDLFRKFKENDMLHEDLSDNELAKTHIQYMNGGKAGFEDERLFSFEFPERKGALKKFLDTLNFDWNVSLFHYRNYGGDIAKVLVGIQVPCKSNSEFDDFLKRLDYNYKEETNNTIYQKLLK